MDGEVARAARARPCELTAAPHEIEVRRDGLRAAPRSRSRRGPASPRRCGCACAALQEAKAGGPPAVMRSAGRDTSCACSRAAASRWAPRAASPAAARNETLREVELHAAVLPRRVREVTNAQFRRFQAGALLRPLRRATTSTATRSRSCRSPGSRPPNTATGSPPRRACRPRTRRATASSRPRRRSAPATACPPRPSGRAPRVTPDGGPLKYPWGAVAARARPAPATTRTRSARPLVAVVLQGYDDRYPGERAPSARFPPNALGFFDLGGNVAEWVHDVYSIPPAGRAPGARSRRARRRASCT